MHGAQSSRPEPTLSDLTEMEDWLRARIKQFNADPTGDLVLADFGRFVVYRNLESWERLKRSRRIWERDRERDLPPSGCGAT